MTSAPSLTSPTNVLGQQDFIELGGHFFATPLGSHVAQWACRALSIHKINALHHQYRTYSGAAFTERVLADPRVNVTYHVVGKENLQSLLLMLLKYADSPEGENPAHFIVSFLNIQYSRESHKAAPSAFSSTLPEAAGLYRDCQRILEELKKLKEETSQLKKNSSRKK